MSLLISTSPRRFLRREHGEDAEQGLGGARSVPSEFLLNSEPTHPPTDKPPALRRILAGDPPDNGIASPSAAVPAVPT